MLVNNVFSIYLTRDGHIYFYIASSSEKLNLGDNFIVIHHLRWIITTCLEIYDDYIIDIEGNSYLPDICYKILYSNDYSIHPNVKMTPESLNRFVIEKLSHPENIHYNTDIGEVINPYFIILKQNTLCTNINPHINTCSCPKCGLAYRFNNIIKKCMCFDSTIKPPSLQ